MMKVEEVKKLAGLARIEVSDVEAEHLQKEFSSILDYVSELNEVAAGEQVPEVGSLYNVMREDANPHESGVYTDDLVREMPQTEQKKEGVYLKVKKIL